MHNIYYDHSFNNIFRSLCHDLMTRPDFIVGPRGLETFELIDTTIVLSKPKNCVLTLPERKLSRRYLAGEILNYIVGIDNLQDYSALSSFWNNLSDDGERINSAYGKLILHDQLENGQTQFMYAYRCLCDDIYTRKAVMVIYERSHSKKSKDNPCTMNLQFICRDNKLSLINNMRSNDIWYGLSYDLPFFTLVLRFMLVKLRAVCIDIELGSYIHRSTSTHIYSRHYSDAAKCAISIEDDSAGNYFGPLDIADTDFNSPQYARLQEAVTDSQYGYDQDYTLFQHRLSELLEEK